MNEGQAAREALRNALRDCIAEACAIAQARSSNQPLYVEEKRVWERTGDGSFRPRRIVVPHRAFLLSKYGPKFEDLDSYRRAMEVAQGEPVVGPQINAMVGATNFGAFRLDGDRIVGSLADVMLRDDGRIEFDEDRFQQKWEEIVRDFDATELVRTSVAPLPNLVAPFPIKLAKGIELDRLTDGEVASCADLGFLGRSLVPGFETVQAREAVGLRCLTTVPKTVGDWPNLGEMPDGEFGRRPAWAQHLLTNDVLSALRLVKEGRIYSAGTVSTIEGWILGGMKQYMPSRGGILTRFGQYELSAVETADLQGVWAHLSGGLLEARRFLGTSLRRFNLALERDLMEDRIVDLMIAAESLFLHDAGTARDRGEARFRLALRAAAFVESPRYTRRQVFRVMREGYDIRSQIVHGGTATESRLPDKPNANVSDLATAVEGIMRLGLRKGLVTPPLGEEGFWECLLLPEA